MKQLSNKDLAVIDGGFWKTVLAALSAGASFALGQDIKEVWEEGWNDPYGRD